MRDYFYTLADQLCARLHGDEILLLNLSAEDSDFVRLNHNRVRQAGHVTQRVLAIDLIAGQRHATAQCDVSGELTSDLALLDTVLNTLRAQYAHLPDDPYLYFATEIHNTEHRDTQAAPDSATALSDILRLAAGLDLVGIWASGMMYHGFANSLGQRNWHSRASFNLDWSCYHATDKAVKSNYAGFAWDATELERKLAAVREQLAILARPAKTLTPGRYRAYLAPAALSDILDMMSWGGFGLKSHRTAQTPLLKMVREGSALHAGVTLREDHSGGLTPPFTDSGFIKPANVNLITAGIYGDCLVDPRSAREYHATVNSEQESPSSLNLAAGTLPRDEVLRELDTGLYINNLWYCNFSDRNACRITGMTRFACFWVEHGVIQAPVNVMRFDDTVYHLLGDGLRGLTREREFLFDASSYQQRSTRSHHLPGALVDDMTFTL